MFFNSEPENVEMSETSPGVKYEYDIILESSWRNAPSHTRGIKNFIIYDLAGVWCLCGVVGGFSRG